MEMEKQAEEATTTDPLAKAIPGIAAKQGSLSGQGDLAKHQITFEMPHDISQDHARSLVDVFVGLKDALPVEGFRCVVYKESPAGEKQQVFDSNDVFGKNYTQAFAAEPAGLKRKDAGIKVLQQISQGDKVTLCLQGLEVEGVTPEKLEKTGAHLSACFHEPGAYLEDKEKEIAELLKSSRFDESATEIQATVGDTKALHARPLTTLIHLFKLCGLTVPADKYGSLEKKGGNGEKRLDSVMQLMFLQARQGDELLIRLSARTSQEHVDGMGRFFKSVLEECNLDDPDRQRYYQRFIREVAPHDPRGIKLPALSQPELK